MFGYKIVHESEYKELRRAHVKFQKLINVHRWFSGWTDLDIIWDYILEDTNFGGISGAREKYARARKTDEYGKPL